MNWRVAALNELALQLGVEPAAYLGGDDAALLTAKRWRDDDGSTMTLTLAVGLKGCEDHLVCRCSRAVEGSIPFGLDIGKLPLCNPGVFDGPTVVRFVGDSMLHYLKQRPTEDYELELGRWVYRMSENNVVRR